MPIGPLKNTLYSLALPVLGKRCEWRQTEDADLTRILQKHHAVGACIQRFEKGVLKECSCAGFARLEGEKVPVLPHTVFRTASIAKMVTALLVFRLQTLGRLNVQQDVSELLGIPVHNPHAGEAPITLAMLLSHTSSIVDSPAYFASFATQTPLSELLKDPQTWLPCVPGTAFRYSNLAAGMIGCILEKQTGMTLDALAQQELFAPLGVSATFDTAKADPERTADGWRVLPARRMFSAAERICTAHPLESPDPERHYLLASGNLYLTTQDLARLALAAWSGADGFINEASLRQMQTPLLAWPQKEVPLRHGMGLFKLEDSRIHSEPLWGHQGFAYGAVNGVFFDAHGNGFVSLTTGVSERRLGHLALVNRGLIQWAAQKGG